jgi:hypothetical protein
VLSLEISSGSAMLTIVGRIQFTLDVAALRSGTFVKNFGDLVCDELMIFTRFKMDPLENSLGIAPVDYLRCDGSKLLDR